VTILGVASVGQTPRPDLEAEFRRHGGGADVVVVGALDGLTRDEVAAIAARSSEYPLQTRLADGTVVEIAKDELEPLLARAAEKLVEVGAGVVVLACAGDLRPLECAVPLVVPGRILPALVETISRTRRIGVVTPNGGQREAARRKWEGDGFDVRVASASPFAEDELREAAAELSDESLELVVLDCMGHDHAYRARFAELCGRPVLAAQSLVARVAAELVEGLGAVPAGR
jgi:protein AroM